MRSARAEAPGEMAVSGIPGHAIGTPAGGSQPTRRASRVPAGAAHGPSRMGPMPTVLVEAGTVMIAGLMAVDQPPLKSGCAAKGVSAMKAEVYWVPGPWPGRLGILPRPRGGDWLADALSPWGEGRGEGHGINRGAYSVVSTFSSRSNAQSISSFLITRGGAMRTTWSWVSLQRSPSFWSASQKRRAPPASR